MTQKSFSDLNLIAPLLKALEVEGYTHPTPIQEQAIPHILEKRDLLGCAQTGTGKTAAFALPILQILAASAARKGAIVPIRALVLTPTRELAAQIGESFAKYGKNLGITGAVIFGGVGQGPQTAALRDGIDILVATPGRLLDLMDQRFVDLSHLEIFVLDEADRMLDMGFVNDVKRVLKVLPKKRHSLFFSATMPPDIQRLAQEILTDPVKVEVTPVATTAEKIVQSVYFVEKHDKRRLLEHLMGDASISRALVFTRTKHGADRVAKFLNQYNNELIAEAIHGNKSQNNRIRALDNFKAGKTRFLVATDIAARGIDIDGVSHVINFELPNIAESYVHRIGRTARAGAEGIAISFCDREEQEYLRDIERLIRLKITVFPLPIAGTSTPRDPALRSATERPPQELNHGGRGRSARPSKGRAQSARQSGRGRSRTEPTSIARSSPARSAGLSTGNSRRAPARRGSRAAAPRSERPASGRDRPSASSQTAPAAKTSWWSRIWKKDS